MATPVTFSGWQAFEDKKRLTADQEPISGRTYTMFHGTLLSNARTIISQGFQPSQKGMLGTGVYISRNIDKAKCYPLNTDKKDKVVFKLKVRVGKVKIINADNHPMQKTWHQNGYDCAWVPPHSKISAIKSGREEDCVWDPSRITVIDVACCMDPGKRKELRQLIRRQAGEGEGEAECSLCRQNASQGQHYVQRCWECGENICHFQSKHECREN